LKNTQKDFVKHAKSLPKEEKPAELCQIAFEIKEPAQKGTTVLI
jgi:hypothetical protein